MILTRSEDLRSIAFLLFILLVLVHIQASAQDLPKAGAAKNVLLPNGWSLSPAGRNLPLGDLPLNIQISNSGSLMAVTNNGQGKHSIQLIDPKTEKTLDDHTVGKAWYGLKFSSDNKKLYASGANDNIILIYSIQNNKLGRADTLKLGKPWPNKIGPTGIDIDDQSKRLFTVTKEDNSLYVVDLQARKVINKTPLGHEAYSCLLSPDNNRLYITLWGGDKVAVYDTKTFKLITEIATESHPNELIQTRNGRFLFVANSNDNSVSVIDTRSKKVIEVISAALYPTKLAGSTTNGLALSVDEKSLYIANANNNCLAVFNVSVPGKSKAMGLFLQAGILPMCER